MQTRIKEMQAESTKQSHRQENKRPLYWASKGTTKMSCLLKHVVFEAGFESECKQVHSILDFVMKKEPEMFHSK